MFTVKKSGAALFLVAAVALLSFFTACSNEPDSGEEVNEVEFVDTSVTSTAKKTNLKTLKTAVIQYDSSEILEKTWTAAQTVFDENNIAYDLYVGEGSDPIEGCLDFANNVVSNGGYDSVMIIGSKAADDVYSEVRTASKIPIVFAAPDEPVLNTFAQRVNSDPDKVYGITIKQNISFAQFDMINSFQPTITYLGVIYFGKDKNSQRYVAALEKRCNEYGVVLNKQEAHDEDEFIYLIESVGYFTEAITLVPENSLGNMMDRVSKKAIAEDIPLYGIEDPQYASKFPASICYDYSQIGKDAAQLTVNTMYGTGLDDQKRITFAYPKVYGNSELLKKFKITVPEEYKDMYVEAE